MKNPQPFRHSVVSGPSMQNVREKAPWGGTLAIALLVTIFAPGCGAGAEQQQLKKDLANLKNEVARLSSRQDALEQEIARRNAADREHATRPAAAPPPKAEPKPQAGPYIPTLPVVKLNEPKAEASRTAPSAEVREPGLENPEIQGAVQPESNQDPGRVFTKGMRQFAEKDCGNAVVTFEEFLRLAPTHPKAAQAIMNIGECYFKRGEYAIALSEYTRLEQLYQDSKLLPMAMYRAGICLKNLKDPKGAREMFQRLSSSYPGDPAAAMAEKELAHLK